VVVVVVPSAEVLTSPPAYGLTPVRSFTRMDGRGL